jgi:hypothetical protein
VNPYPARIEELHACLESRYGQRDRQATEILLASQLDSSISLMRPPWIIIETDYPQRETADGWFSFGGETFSPVRSLSIPRVAKSRDCEMTLQDWLAEWPAKHPQLFVDAEWRRMPTSGRGASLMMVTHSYAVLLSMCVRMRVVHPRGDHAVRLDQETDSAELARLTRRVLDNAHRGRLKPSPAIPGSFLFWCELLQRIAPMQSNWEALTGAIASTARNIALLYNDGRAADWRAAERVLRDCVPYLTGWLLEHTASTGTLSNVRALQVFRKASLQIDRPLVGELARLCRVGVLKPLGARELSSTKEIGPNDKRKHMPWRYQMRASDFRLLLDREKEILV